jgi:hypothetical protein
METLMEQYRDKRTITSLGDVARECPFCGGTDICLVERKVNGVGATYYGVRCVSCHANIESCFFERPWDAINAWNGGDEGRYCDRVHPDEQ